VTQTSLIQRATSDGIRSRVIAGSEAVMQSGIAVGLLVSGFVTAAAGASGAFALASGASAIAATILLLGLLGAPEVGAAIPKLAPGSAEPGAARVRELSGVSQSIRRSAPASQPLRPLGFHRLSCDPSRPWRAAAHEMGLTPRAASGASCYANERETSPIAWVGLDLRGTTRSQDLRSP
jgi:hypothetical protein